MTLPDDVVETARRAMQNAVIRDDEGEFPRLFDLLDFSGENKAVTVSRGLARAALEAARYGELVEALTPSADTKYAYLGEFKMPLVRVDECGDEYTEHVTVSWDVIKEIMAAIKARALLSTIGAV